MKPDEQMFFKLPDSELSIKIKHSVYFEVWIEVDHDGRGENTWEFGGEYETLKETIEHCFYQLSHGRFR